MRNLLGRAGLCLSLLSLWAAPAAAQKVMENLGRGLVAVSTGGSNVFLSWRMLGTDPSGIAFNVYRGTTKLNSAPTTLTNYTDNAGGTGNSYSVRPVINNVEQGSFNTVTGNVWGQQYFTINIQQPAGGTGPDGVAYTYEPNDCSVGDMDGDGEYEIVVKWYPTNAKDNSQSGNTGNCFLDCYKLNGTRLWRIDLGINIRSGAHYTQFQVYDYDSDGRAEMMCKTAPGSRDSSGAYLSMGPAASDTDSSDYRNSAGYILSGPEYLTVFNGLTGREMATINYNPPRGTVGNWGDTYGNRVDRFLAGTAYLDGQRPSAVFCRGYYTRATLWAVDWRNGQLTQRWFFDSEVGGKTAYRGQGAHSLTIGDVDNDGRDEITYGACAVDDNGNGLYTTGLGHGDALHMSDMDPDRPGQEVWMVHEDPGSYGANGLEFRDARTGALIWGKTGNNADVGRGLALNMDNAHRGFEAWGSQGAVYDWAGAQISTSKPTINFGVFWDGDRMSEILDSEVIDKWNGNGTNRLLTAYNFGAADNNGTKANPGLSGDILGDWREEVIWRNANNTQLMIFTTTNPSNYRMYTWMHDPQYRVAVAWQNTAYNQPPHTSFYVGEDMAAPPVPNIVLAGASNATATRTNTPAPPTATRTSTPVPPTSTRTNTPVPPTATRTASPTSTATLTLTRTATSVPPTATSTLTRTATASLTATLTLTRTSTAVPPTLTSTSTLTRTSTVVPPTLTSTSTLTRTSTAVPPTQTSTASATRTASPTLTQTSLPTLTSTNTPLPPTLTLTASLTRTLTATSSPTSTRTATSSATASHTPTASSTSSSTPTLSATNSATSTSTRTDSPTVTLTPTGTLPPTLTSTATPSSTATLSRTATPSATSSATSTASTTPTASSTPSSTATRTDSPTVTLTPTGTLPPTLTSTASATPSSSPTATATLTRTQTATPTLSATSSATSTATSSSTASYTPTSSSTSSTTSTRTASPTVTLTPTGTLPPTLTSTASATPTSSSTSTSSLTRTQTATLTASATPSSTSTLAPTLTATASYSPTALPTATITPSPTMPAGTEPIVFPNPVSTGTVTILPQEYFGFSHVTVQIFTAGFKPILEKHFYGVPAGTTLQVDLVDNWGQDLADGVYYVYVTTKKDRKRATLVIGR